MRTHITWLILMLIILAGCKDRGKDTALLPDQTGVTVSGVIENGEDVMVTIDRMGANAFIPIDSVRCDKNGAFEFNFQNPAMDFYALKYCKHGYVTLITFPGDHIIIKGNPDALHPYSVSGSKDSEMVHDLAERHKTVLEELQLVAFKTEELQGDENFSDVKLALNRKFDSITNSFSLYSIAFIRNNTGSPAMLIALYNQYGPRLPVFEMPADMDIYRFVDSSLSINYSENEAVKSLHSQLVAVDHQLQLLQKEPELSIGMSAPDFVMKTNEGQLLSLSDLKGQYVLMQFWASWSKPSMDENPYLSLCQEKFKSRKFTILQVSVDNEKQEWLQAIEDQELAWHHVSDLQRWESAVVDLYDVERIPANYLVDPAGIIVEKDIFEEEIEQALEKHLK